jgi:accessory gene regulator B
MAYKKVVQTLSGYIAEELNLTEKKRDKIRFGIELLISTFSSVFTTLFLAWLLGNFKPVLFILFSSAMLKQVSGGIHLKTVWECTLFSALFCNLLGLVAISFEGFIYNYWLIFLVISVLYIIISLLLWSPAEVEEKPIKSEEKRRNLKLISILISSFILILVAILAYFYQERFILINTSIILGLLLQTSTINPFAYKLRDFYYQFRNLI